MIVTGAGAVIGPLAGVDALWEQVAHAGTAGSLAVHPRYKALGEFVHIRAEPSDLAELVPGIKKPLPSKQSLLALAAVEAAIAADLLWNGVVDPNRIAIVTSSEFGPSTIVDEATTAAVAFGPRAVSPLRFARSVHNAVVGDIARRYGITGPTLSLAGESPLPVAKAILARRRADVVVCVGVDEIGGTVARWAEHGCLATELAFADRRLVPADAAGALVLRRITDCEIRPNWAAVVTELRSRRRSRESSTVPVGPDHDDRVSPRGGDATILLASSNGLDVSCGLALSDRPASRPGLLSTPWIWLGEPFAAKPVIGTALAADLVLATNHALAGGAVDIRTVVVESSDLSGNAATSTLDRLEGEPQ
jgi:hypothetical protein